MFEFKKMLREHSAGIGAVDFADGGAPLISTSLRIDGEIAEIIIDPRGVNIVWCNAECESFIVSADGIVGMRLLALLRPAMTRAQLAAIPGVQIDLF